MYEEFSNPLEILAWDGSLLDNAPRRCTLSLITAIQCSLLKNLSLHWEGKSQPALGGQADWRTLHTSLLRSKHNIEHDVTNCPFLTKKYSKCDSLADFLSYLEHVMIEAVELLNKFEESKPET